MSHITCICLINMTQISTRNILRRKMKIYNYEIVFQEFPDEVTLALNISNCPCHCKGCHSPFLAEDNGVKLTEKRFKTLLKNNPGITCVGFMGGDRDPQEVMDWARWIKEYNPNLKVGWYSGRDEFPNNFDVFVFDYIKIGHYDESRGPLSSPMTNQIMFKAEYKYDSNGVKHLYRMNDITNKFHKS